MDANSEHLLARHGLRSCADLAVLTARGGRKSLAGVRGAAEGAGVLGVELVVVFSLVLKGYGVCSVWVHGW